IKQQYPDCLIFFRLGDFYELFSDDAVIASKELGIVLTKRVNVPMCGIPWHAHEMYLTRLVKNGHKIAICDQIETPEEAKKRGYKAIVERKVTRIVTSGTLIEDSMLGDKQNNFLLALSNEFNNRIGVAYADVSTGRFFVEEIDSASLLSIISKVSPSEIICPDKLLSKKEFLEKICIYKSIIWALPNNCSSTSAEENLAKFFDIKFIDSFGSFSKCEIEAISEITEYISSVYKSHNIGLSPPKLVKTSEIMHLDHFTRKSLEIDSSPNGKNCSLLHNIDKTLTPHGARLLSRWVMAPLIDTDKINKRLDHIEFFVNHRQILNNVRNTLNHFPDLERALSRILINKAGPRDLKAISISIQKSHELKDNLLGLNFSFDVINNIQKRLDAALVDNLPLLARDGNFIKKGYDAELDEYNELLNNGEYVIQKLQKTYIEEIGITTLKIKNNGILGYFIEVSSNYVSKIPYHFIHRQTLGSSIRYTTKELLDIANKIYSANSNANHREMQIFEELIQYVISFKDSLRVLTDNISFLDVISSLAVLAIENKYVKPIFTNDLAINIRNGRHPVVENMLKAKGTKFIPNNYYLNDNSKTAILTGPNMGGKSTYLRMNALIIIMAQIGSFVPADEAIIGIVDKIFSRVGASDDISYGKSTFMVEMLETATILRQATHRSFIILDEIGRGTSTYDGLAIAWAVVEELALNIKARTIFATHYHELANIKDIIPNVIFLTVKVEEWNEKIVFLYNIEEGFANKSYGINVALLAGFPDRVINRAKEILKNI
ncbi:MAG: DNA mismatch repair protein MutS, partial [Holosporales bacterium]|nr:DNA mismatch repair protein MutS [Holosporales bacterium]